MGPSPFWLLLAIVPLAASVPEVNIDLVVILHFIPYDDTNMQSDAAKKAVMEIFPTVFELGPKKSRVAMVYNWQPVQHAMKLEWKSTPLCASAAEIKSNIQDVVTWYLAPHRDNSLGKAFAMARDIFNKASPNQNGRVIFVVSHSGGWVLQQLITESDKTIFEDARKDGIQTYAVYGKNARDPNITASLTLVAGHIGNIHQITSIKYDFKKEAFDWLKNRTYLFNRCVYVEKCFFFERQQCLKLFYTPNVTVDDGDCATVNRPSPPGWRDRCDVNECNQTCNDLWPIDRVQCGEDDCGKITIQTPKRYAQLEYCKRDPEIKCPACPTSASTTTATGPTTPTAITGITAKSQITGITAKSQITGITAKSQTTPNSAGGKRAQVGADLFMSTVVVAMIGKM